MTALAGLVLSLLCASPLHPPERPKEAPRVYAGVYLSDVSGFDLREGRFQADLDLWLKWSGPKEPPSLRFVNGELENKEELERESDGDWHSARWRVQGTFRGTFPLQAFPFDKQSLRIQLATADDTARLLPDLGSSGMARQFSITGWEYEPFFRSEMGREVVASDLGSIKSEGRSRVLDSVAFVVDLNRPRTSNILKFMLPLAIILAMAFLVFVIPPPVLEVRSAMGVTSLLSVVAFHFAMSGSLPDVPYLVAADRLFLGSYVLVLLSIFETVLTFRLGEKYGARARRIDRLSLGLLPMVAVLIGLSVVFPSAPPAPREAPRAAPPAAPSAPSPREELRVGVASLSTLNAQGLNSLMRRGLTDVGADGELRPHLAEAVPSMTDESVRLLPDGGMLVRWRLRQGLRWSDGAPLTAKDLAFSLSLVPSPDRAQVRQVDERTLEIRYQRRLAEALVDFPIYPEHVARQLSADGGIEALRLRNQTEPLPGDGPYRLASFTPDQEAVFERNPHFAGPRPRLARIRLLVRTPEQMREELSNGKLDFLPVVPTTIIADLQRAPAALVSASLEDSLLLLQPDLHVPALADPKVRRALLMAIDRKAIAAVYAEGGARVAHTFRPDDATDYAADAEPTPFAPAEARRVLKDAGLRELPLILAETTAGSGYEQATNLVAQQLSAVGVKLTRQVLTPAKITQAYTRGSHGGLLLHARRERRLARYFNLPMLPGAVLDVRTPRPHFPPELVDAYHLYESSLFPERQRLLSMRLQRAFAHSLPLLPLAFGTQVAAQHRSLEGFGLRKASSPFWNVETWAASEASAPAAASGSR